MCERAGDWRDKEKREMQQTSLGHYPVLEIIRNYRREATLIIRPSLITVNLLSAYITPSQPLVPMTWPGG